MISALRTSVSGLRAAAKTVEASASNIANMRDRIRPGDAELGGGAAAGRTATPRPDAFRPLRVDRHSLEPGGVKADFSEIDPPHVRAYDPSSPLADDDGTITLPNVDLETELVNLIRAQRAYEANLKPIKAEDEMLGELLDTET